MVEQRSRTNARSPKDVDMVGPFGDATSRFNADGDRYNLPLYWFSNQFSLVGWNTGSALVTVGLVSSCRGLSYQGGGADTI